MAIRTPYRGPEAQITQVPQIRVSMAAAKSYGSLAQVMGGLADGAQDIRDRIAVTEAKRAGMKAGAGGAPTLREDQWTLTGSAYNDAALQSYANTLEAKARAHLSELSVKHAVDPSGYKEAAGAYISGVTQEISEVADWLAPVFEQKFKALATADAAQITGAYTNVLRDRQKAEIFTLEDEIMRNIDATAGRLFDDDPDVSASWLVGAASDWQRVQMMYNQIGPDGRPLLKAEDLAKAEARFWDRVYASGLKAWVDEQPDKTAAFRAISSGTVQANVRAIGENGEITDAIVSVNPSEQMTRTERDKIIGYARSQMNAEIRALNRQDRLERERQTALQENTAKALYDNLIAGDGLSVDAVQAQRENLTGTDYRALLTAAQGAEAVIDEQDAIIRIEDAMREGGDFWTMARQMYADRQITSESLRYYRSQNDLLRGRSGLRTDYQIFSDTFDDMLRTIGSATASAYDPVRLALPVAKFEFHQWWSTFPQQTDPKTGQPFGRFPTAEEGRAKTFTLMRSILSGGQRSIFERGFLGNIRVPTSHVPVGDGVAPYAVRDQATGKIDEDASALNLFKAFGVTSTTGRENWPPELKRHLAELKRYMDAVRALEEVAERIDGQ